MNRTWYLYARDEVGGDSGYIDEWSIRVYYSTPAPPPAITSVSPNPVTGSNSTQPFTINGSGFVSGANVTLRDLTAGQVFPDRVPSSFGSTQIVINPNFTAAAATWSVEVINPDGQSSGQFQFQVVAPGPPVITNVSPNPVPGSNSAQPFTISGSGFASGANVTLRDLTAGQTFPNRVPSSFGSTQIVINPNFTAVPAIWSVEVINPDGQSSGQFQFQVVASGAPSISSVSPSPVPASNSTQPFTINGSGFVSGANVTLRDLTAGQTFPNRVPSSFSSTQIVINPNFTAVPAIWSVEVINPDGQSSGQFQFQVVAPAQPAISSVSPNPVPGSDIPQPFTINGGGFVSGANVTLRDLTAGQAFPNRAASSFNSAQIVINPNFTTAAATWSVEVINPDGQSSGQFQFQVTSSVASCNPGALSGVVRTAQTGAVLREVMVSLGTGAVSTTDSFGFYSFPSLAPGSYGLRVDETGYEPFNVSVGMCGNRTWDVALTTRDTVYGPSAPSAYSADPVNVATGNYVFSREDLRVPAPGIPFSFERTYNSQAGASGTDGPLGFGWSHNWDVSVDVASSPPNVIIRWGDGRRETWTPDGVGGFTAQYGVFDTLQDDGDGSYSLLRRDQVVYDFNVAGRLTTLTDRNGNTLASAYSGSDLSTITDPAGRAYHLARDGSGRITGVADALGRSVSFDYDGAGNLVSSTDPNGNVTRYTYDTDHQMLTVVDPRGNVLVENEYDSAQRVVSVQRDALGTATTYQYEELDRRTTVIQDPGGLAVETVYFHDGLLRLIREQDALGNSTEYAYDSAGNRVEVVDRKGQRTQYAYDASGNVVSKADALGNSTVISYDGANDPLTRTDALRNTTQFQYDASGNLVRTLDALGGQTLVTYDSRGFPLTIQDAKGNVTTHEYDAEGNRTKTIDALGNETVFTYDAVGRRLTRLDALGRLSQWSYDPSDNLLAVTDPLGNVTSHLYDGNDNRIATTDALLRATTFVYDAKDRRVETIDPMGVSSFTAYDALDRRILITDRNGNTTTFAPDAVGNRIQRVDALGYATDYAYDANGNRLTATDPNGNATTFTYDELDRLLSTTDALVPRNTTTTTYDELGRVIAQTDAKGQVTQLTYDALGRLVEVTDPPLGGKVTLGYDANGNRTSQIEPNGDTTFFTYDALDRLVQTVEPLGGQTDLVYDAVGNRVSRTDPNGATTAYAYDALDRLESVVYSGGPTVTYAYDAVGNRLSMQDGLGTTTYTYDPLLDRVTAVTGAFGKTVQYGYDPAGNRIALTYPGGNVVSYGYDALNRLATVTDWLGGVTTYSYDPAGPLVDTLLPNGTRAVASYDAADRLVGLDHLAQDASVMASQAFTLDPVGNPLAETRVEVLGDTPPGVAETYTYASESRIVDRASVLQGLTAYSHDANGNRVQDAGPSETRSQVFDSRNLLVTRVTAQGMVLHAYDGDGRRMSRTESGAEHRFVLDTALPLFRVLQETDAAGTLLASYVYGLGLIERIDALGTRSVYHFDRNGSTLALTDDTGVVTDAYSYTPFGALLAEAGTTANPFTFLGAHGVMGEGDDLYYVRARFFDAETGRFVSKDPKAGSVNSPQSLNQYVYALNSPISLVDISGLSPSEVGKADLAPLLEFLGSEAIRNTLLAAGAARNTSTSLSPINDGLNALGKGTTILAAISAFAEAVNASIRAGERIERAGIVDGRQAALVGWEELTTVGINLITAPGRGLANFLIVFGSGDDPGSAQSIRDARVVGDLRLNKVLTPIGSEDIENFAEAYVNAVPTTLDKIVTDPIQELGGAFGGKLYDWGLFR